MLRKWLLDLSYIYITFDVSRTFSSCAPKKIQSTWLDSKAQSNSQYYWHIFELTKSIEWFTQVFSTTVHMFTSMAGCLSRLIYTQVCSKKQTWRLKSLRQPDWPSVIEGRQGNEVPDFRICRYEALRPPDGERCRTKRIHWSGRPPVAHPNVRFVRICIYSFTRLHSSLI